jgi:hypothetical protein
VESLKAQRVRFSGSKERGFYRTVFRPYLKYLSRPESRRLWRPPPQKKSRRIGKSPGKSHKMKVKDVKRPQRPFLFYGRMKEFSRRENLRNDAQNGFILLVKKRENRFENKITHSGFRDRRFKTRIIDNCFQGNYFFSQRSLIRRKSKTWTQSWP